MSIYHQRFTYSLLFVISITLEIIVYRLSDVCVIIYVHHKGNKFTNKILNLRIDF